MAMRALDIAVFLIVLSIAIVYVPPIAAPQWADSINTGPFTQLNTYNSFNLNKLASYWSAFSGSGWTSAIDFALLSLHMILQALLVASLILVAPIAVVFTLQATFPVIPVVIFMILGAVMFVVYGWAWFQILSGRPGEVLT